MALINGEFLVDDKFIQLFEETFYFNPQEVELFISEGYLFRRILCSNTIESFHRFLYEQVTDNSLNCYEHIHHLNGNCKDNRFDNLIKVNTEDHIKLHKFLRSLNQGELNKLSNVGDEKLIDYEDIKSEWLPIPHNSSVEFTIKKDATKVMKNSARTGNPYPSYEFGVEFQGEKLRWSTLIIQYRKMVNDAGKPASLVGSKWRFSHVSVDGNDSYEITFLGGAIAPSPSTNSPEVSKK